MNNADTQKDRLAECKTVFKYPDKIGMTKYELVWWLIEQAEQLKMYKGYYKSELFKKRNLHEKYGQLHETIKEKDECIAELEEQLGNQMPVDFESADIIKNIDDSLGPGWAKELSEALK